MELRKFGLRHQTHIHECIAQQSLIDWTTRQGRRDHHLRRRQGESSVSFGDQRTLPQQRRREGGTHPVARRGRLGWSGGSGGSTLEEGTGNCGLGAVDVPDVRGWRRANPVHHGSGGQRDAHVGEASGPRVTARGGSMSDLPLFFPLHCSLEWFFLAPGLGWRIFD